MLQQPMLNAVRASVSLWDHLWQISMLDSNACRWTTLQDQTNGPGWHMTCRFALSLAQAPLVLLALTQT